MKQDVIDVTQSPMNAKQWLLTLRCRHEVWVTASRRPQRMTMKCFECAKKPAEEPPANG